MTLRLLLTWSLRDLKSRWIQVVTIALVIGLGIGSFASFNSLTAWRIASNEASFEATRMYDLKLSLSDGSYIQQGRLSEVVDGIPSANSVIGMQERLIVPTLLEVVSEAEKERAREDPGADPDGILLFPGRIVGMDISQPEGPDVTRLHIVEGRNLTPADAGEPIVVLESKFATTHELPAEGQARVAGGRQISYVGHALAPEYFIVLTEGGAVFAHSQYGVMFTSRETAQDLAERPGMVNELVLLLDDSASRETVIAELEQAIAAALPTFGVSVTEDIDDPIYRSITEDVEGDQQSSNVIAIFIFIGAVSAAFNLTTRMVETQRREIGIGMALGVPRRRIALRPIAVGAQIAILGILFGLAVGWVIGWLMEGVMTEFIPLPIWEAPFQFVIFGAVTVIGMLVLLIAIGYPVWRAVNVEPIDAIRTGHLAARGGGLAPLMTRLRIPGATFAQMPFRNVARAPRRALLTILGIAAAVAITVSLVGTLDAYVTAIRDGRDETLKTAAERLEVDLIFPIPIESEVVRGIEESQAIAQVEPGLRVGGSIASDQDAEGFDVLIRFMEFDSDIWTPTAIEGALDSQTRGVVLAKKAASDLGVTVGDEITLTHPVSEGFASFSLRETRLPVLAIHPFYLRTYVYMDMRHTDILNVTGLTNRITVIPSEGNTLTHVKQDLFDIQGVVSIDTVAAGAQLVEDLLDQFISILRIMEAIPLLLAILIAYNTASIAMDERRREHATMAAYGVPYRTILRMAVIESMILGIFATIVGIVVGIGLLLYLLFVILPASQPDFGISVTFTPASAIIVIAFGILAVAAAPLLTARKLRREDIPATLRVME